MDFFLDNKELFSFNLDCLVTIIETPLDEDLPHLAPLADEGVDDDDDDGINDDDILDNGNDYLDECRSKFQYWKGLLPKSMTPLHFVTSFWALFYLLESGRINEYSFQPHIVDDCSDLIVERMIDYYVESILDGVVDQTQFPIQYDLVDGDFVNMRPRSN